MIIPALVVYTDNYVPLLRRWTSSLPEGFRAVPRRLALAAPTFGFRTQSWYDAIRLKLEYFVEYLSTAPEGQLVMCSDADIYFVRQTDDLARAARRAFDDDPGLDLWIMQENTRPEVNGGFYFVRNSPRVRTFLRDAAAFTTLKSPYADQEFFNADTTLRRQFIPNRYVAWGMEVFDRGECLLHHAVCCATVDQKIDQQDRVLKYVFQLTLRMSANV